MSKKLSTRDLEDLLESDDDLPDSYEEVPDVPAYQNDKRFDALQFNLLENEEWPALCKPKQNTSPPKLNREVNETTKINATVFPKKEVKNRPVKVAEELNHENKVLVKRGVLSKQDLYCLQALISISADVNIMWFVNFLMHKDMQKGKYKFLRSCLIQDNMVEKKTPVCKINSKCDIKKYKYELNIL